MAHFDAELVEALRRQFEAFRQKFGRDPGPNDPLFFEPDADEPRRINPAKLEAVIVAAMRKAGVDAAYIHAYRRTGMLLTEDNVSRWSKRDRAEFRTALDEYEALWARRN